MNGDQPRRPVSDISTNENKHDHVAVGDVDEAHDAERKRQAEREQGIEAADQHALDDEVEERLRPSPHAPK